MRRRRNFTPHPLEFAPYDLGSPKWYDRFSGLFFLALIVALPIGCVMLAIFAIQQVDAILTFAANAIAQVIP